MSEIKLLRLTSLIEASSFLLLLFVAMPMKYMMGKPLAVSIVGSVHGGLFLLFAMLLFRAWGSPLSSRQVFQGFVAAVLPFGPFFFDRVLKELIEPPNLKD